MKKILTIASLLCAAVMCFSCGETPGGETTINNVYIPTTIKSFKNLVAHILYKI